MNRSIEAPASQLCMFDSINDPEEKTEWSELIAAWDKETDLSLKEKLKKIIIAMVEIKERQAFLTRYRLREFDTWNKVLTEDEGAVAQAHKAEFYKPNLVLTLYENNGCLPGLDAIAKTLERVKGQLSLADYKLTASKRFRHDTTIRVLANSLKKQGILSKEKRFKNKYWALTEKGRAYARKITAGRL